MRVLILALPILSLIYLSAFAGALKKEVSYFPNKKPATERFYRDGKKIGVHKTWYANGHLQSESEFAAPDQMRRYRDWFENGNLSKEILFKDGMESQTKIYRKTGQIYLNRIVRDGRVYGLPGGKACSGTKARGL